MADIVESAMGSDVVVGGQRAPSVVLDLERHLKKRARLEREAQAAKHKALQNKRPSKQAAYKRQCNHTIMHEYFNTSRNSENHSELIRLALSNDIESIVMDLLDLGDPP